MAGVSKATVSRVLNNKPEGVGEETRVRVQKVLDEVGYRNEQAVSVSRPLKSGCIALILPDITNPFFADIAKAVEARAKKAGYIVVLANTDFSEESEKKYIINLLAKKVDGIILIPSGIRSSPEHHLPKKYAVPMVLLDRKFANERNWLGVYSDNTYAAFHACEIMFSHGSRRIAYLSGGTGVSTSLERLEGYKTAVEHYGLAYCPELIKYGDYTVESGYNAIMELERANTQYTAVLAANDLMALGAMNAMRELSYRVPEDIEIIGFDNIPFASYCDPPLTTIQQPTLEMGAKACEMLLQILQGEKVTESVRLHPKMLIRKTTRSR